MRAWLAICAVLGGGAAAMAWLHGLASPFEELSNEPLAWQAAHWLAHPWTLWTSAWLHASPGSLAANLLALAALAIAGAALGADGITASALALAWPLTAIGLLAWPQVDAYAGLGGPIYAAAAVLGVHVARRTPHRWLAVLLFGSLGIKLAAERAWAQPVAFDPSWGSNVVYAAHLTGTLVGAWCACLLDWLFVPRGADGRTRRV